MVLNSEMSSTYFEYQPQLRKPVFLIFNLYLVGVERNCSLIYFPSVFIQKVNIANPNGI